jgi:hypothetical protein
MVVVVGGGTLRSDICSELFTSSEEQTRSSEKQTSPSEAYFL